jgi:hypothetical protein
MYGDCSAHNNTEEDVDGEWSCCVTEMAGEMRLDWSELPRSLPKPRMCKTPAITRSGSWREGDTGISLVPNSESELA